MVKQYTFVIRLLHCFILVAFAGTAVFAQEYILAPSEFRLQLGTHFPINVSPMQRNTGILHTDQGYFASSKSQEAEAYDVETLCLESLPSDFIGDIHLWITINGSEVARQSIPVRRPMFISVVPIDGGRVIRYTLQDQRYTPLEGAPVLLRLKVNGRSLYATGKVTDAKGCCEFPLPLDRFRGCGQCELFSYGVPTTLINIAGTGNTNLPTFKESVGIIASPERVNANLCLQFPVIVAALNVDGSQLPSRAQCNSYFSSAVELHDGIGITTIPVSLFS